MDEILKPLYDHAWPKGNRDICIGTGWHELVLELHNQLVAIDPTYKIIQVKEKFGTLRYYCGGKFNDTLAFSYIAEAELKSSETCEDCGAAGSLREDLGWILTLCDEDYQKTLERRAERKAKWNH